MTSPTNPTRPGGDRKAAVRRPWLPRSLTAHGLDEKTVPGLSYIIVEEIIEETAGSLSTLTIAPWPAADGYGRLRFAVDGVPEVTVLTDDLDAQLYDGWLPHGPHIGDVFASRVDERVLASARQQVWREPLERLLPGTIYDITEQARTVAKLALYAARTDVLTAGQVLGGELRDTVVAPRRRAPARRLDEPPRRRRR